MPISQLNRSQARIIRPFAVAFMTLLASLASSHAAPPQIWFAPADWLPRPPEAPNGLIKYDDYMGLFVPSAPSVMSRVQVLKIFAQTLTWASDDDLRRIFAALKRRNIALALEIGMVTDTDRCGRGVEGYGGQGVAQLVERIAKLGGELAYLAMDEPAWYGHNYTGANACRAPLADIAGGLAGQVAAVRAIFPKVQIGDGEPIGSSPDDGLIREYAEWIDTYRQTIGEPLAFFHADVQWEKPWIAPVAELAESLKAKAIPFGIIYNGDATDLSDETWIAHAEAHYVAYEADGRSAPDQVLFESWVAHPSHLSPEFDPGAFTYLLRRYFRPRSRIAAELRGEGGSGRLTDDTGKPLAEVAVNVAGVDEAGRGIPSRVSLPGVVPAKAAEAVIGLRINTECDCSGNADLSAGTIVYRETKRGAVRYALIPGRNGWQGLGSASGDDPFPFHVRVAADQPILMNSPVFAVTSGADFVLDVLWRVSFASQGSGYITVIFLNQAGKEIVRTNLPLQPGWAPLGTAKTDNAGKFILALPREAANFGDLRLRFDGSDRLRPTEIILQRARAN